MILYIQLHTVTRAKHWQFIVDVMYISAKKIHISIYEVFVNLQDDKRGWQASGNCDNMMLSKKYYDQSQCHEFITSLASQCQMSKGM